MDLNTAKEEFQQLTEHREKLVKETKRLESRLLFLNGYITALKELNNEEDKLDKN